MEILWCYANFSCYGFVLSDFVGIPIPKQTLLLRLSGLFHAKIFTMKVICHWNFLQHCSAMICNLKYFILPSLLGQVPALPIIRISYWHLLRDILAGLWPMVHIVYSVSLMALEVQRVSQVIFDAIWRVFERFLARFCFLSWLHNASTQKQPSLKVGYGKQ